MSLSSVTPRSGINDVLPDKIRLGKEYARNATMVQDLGLIFKTLIRIAN
jgi:lipopolysaccharide/colanic/teichoic acid biosynthesis glycosyltransferase